MCGKPFSASPFPPPGVTETPATVAFSNAKDLIVWLANSHEVSIAVNEIGVSYSLESGVPAIEALDGWINWNGGTCPVDRGLHVIVKTDDGGEITGMAGQFAWAKGTAPRDIVAYRLVNTDDVKRCGVAAAQAIREHDQRRS